LEAAVGVADSPGGGLDQAFFLVSLCACVCVREELNAAMKTSLPSPWTYPLGLVAVVEALMVRLENEIERETRRLKAKRVTGGRSVVACGGGELPVGYVHNYNFSTSDIVP